MVRVTCPAKLNLFLSVGPPDPRGYHPIRTIFQAIDLFDALEIDTWAGPGHQITSDWADLPESNTIERSLRMLGELARIPSLKVHLRKAIPAESGLGGGSSNAAGVLRAIHHFLPAPIASHHLHDVASAVGMDVPFFLVGGRAIGTHYGEELKPLEDTAVRWFVVLRPVVGVSTKEAYAQLDTAPRPWAELPSDPFANLYNDFERVMPCDCEDWSDRLEVHGATGTLLTGSGSAIFGIFDDREQAENAADLLRDEWVRSYGPRTQIPVWVTRSLSRSESLRIETL